MLDRLSKHLGSADKGGSGFRVTEDGLTVEEGVELVKYYCKKMLEMCKTQDYITRVRLTAVMLYRRFFLFSSLMEHDPTQMLLAAVFVAGKAEEAPLTLATRGIDIVKLCNVTKMDLDKLLQSEIRFLQGIKFHLVVFHPHRPLAGFIQILSKEMDTDSSISSSDSEPMKALKRRSEDMLEASLLTDCALLYPPSQIALAAVVKAAEELDAESEGDWKQRGGMSGEQVLDILVRRDAKDEDREKVKETEQVLLEIKELFKHGRAAADKKLYKSASKKLKSLQKLLAKPKNDQQEGAKPSSNKAELQHSEQQEQQKKKKLKSTPPPLPSGPPPRKL